MRQAIIEIFHDIWPMLFIFSVILISIRLTYLYVKKQKIIIYKELFNLFFILYILCLFHIVTFQDVNWSSSNFSPFKEIFRYQFGTRLFFKNVIGNIILFLPYGYFITRFIDSKKPIIVLLLIFISSLSIEITQFLIGRVFDIDDIILNIIGGLFGYLLYLLIDKIGQKLPKFLKTEWFYNIIFLVLIIICGIYLVNIIGV